MGKPNLRCTQLAAKAVYRYLIQQGYSKELDSGFRIIDYRNLANHQGTLIGFEDGEVSEELWEKSLIILDDLGQQKEAVQKYQALRKLIETQTRHPIPWVFETPMAGGLLEKQNSLVGSAHLIRQKVQGAIDALEKFLAPIKKQDPAKYQRCLIACLYWFCWVDEKKSEKELKIPKDVEDFLRDEGVEETMREFGKYLSQKGGLGLRQIKDKDAPVERTAFETVNAEIKLGWCTEQAEVLYAVLRMAGVEAHFVEPKLPVEYYKTLPDPFEPSIPLPAHVATGVQVKMMDENGKPKIWILDLALKAFQADYVEKGYPYWELSLRHMFMAHLSNLGTDQTRHGKYNEAEENFDLALNFGHDSTAYLAMGNYFYLLRKNPPLKRNDEYDQKMLYGKMAIEARPDFAVFQFNWALHSAEKRDWEMSLDAFLKAIDSDPRDREVYHQFGLMLYNMRRYALDKFPKAWDMFKEQMRKVMARYPFYKNRVQEGLKVMQIAVEPKRPSDNQLIKFIKQLEKDFR